MCQFSRLMCAAVFKFYMNAIIWKYLENSILTILDLEMSNTNIHLEPTDISLFHIVIIINNTDDFDKSLLLVMWLNIFVSGYPIQIHPDTSGYIWIHLDTPSI